MLSTRSSRATLASVLAEDAEVVADKLAPNRCFVSSRLAKISENAILRDMAACIVSYVDTEGLRHAVEVEAESLYEAAVLAIRTFKQHNCEPAEMSKLEVEIRSSITHTVNLKKIRSWLQGGARSPKEAVTKERLREIFSE